MKKKYRCLSAFFLIMNSILVNIVFPTISYANETSQEINARSEAVILADADTGEILYEKNADERMYPASITKLMTAMVVLDNCDNLDESITISDDAYMQGLVNSSDAGMYAGQTTTVYECLSGMLVASGNECAYALAEYVGSKLGGDVDTFVAAMNEKTGELGCTSTNFTNPCGLHDDNHYTTAEDMLTISLAVYKYPVIMEIIGQTYFISQAAMRNRERGMDNTHKMLTDSTYEYDEVIGGKTGHTDEAGYTLVTYASHEGRNLVCIVLGAEEDCQYKDTTDLFNWAFGLNEGYVIAEESEETYDIGMVSDETEETDEKETDALGTSQYIYMINLGSGEVLYSKGANEKVPAGGLAGLMAALTTLDYCDINEKVWIAENQMGLGNEGSSTEYSIKLCLYKMIYMESMSCVNAVSDLIESKTGTADYSFIKMMNKKAVELGCANTSFDNVFSLNESASWTSAADMAKIFKAAYASEELRKIINESNADIMTSMFSGGTSLIKYETRGDVTLACIILKGNYESINLAAEELLDSGFEYYENQTEMPKASNYSIYKKYIFTGIICLAYFMLLVLISFILNRKTQIKIPEKIGNIIANLMLAVIVIGCPLYLHNKLEDLTMAKAYFLIATTAIFGVLYFTYTILRHDSDVLHRFKWSDSLLAIYLFGGLIEVFMSGAVDDAVFATYGRYTGYLMDVVYVLVIIIAIMCGRQYGILRYSIPIVTLPLGILAVLNHYNVDPINIYGGREAEILNRYISTIGNVDMFAIFMGTAFAYCGMLFCVEEKWGGRVIAAISAIIAQMSILVCSADGGFIGIIIFYLIALVFIKDRWQFIRYLLSADVFMLTVIAIGGAEKRLAVYMPVDSITQSLLDSKVCISLFIIVTILICMLTFVFVRKGDMTVERRIARRGLYALYAAGFVVLAAGAFMINSSGRTDENSIASLLLIGNEWGNQRGYLWRIAVKGYGELSIWQKLFGIGSSNVSHLFWTQIDPYDNNIIQMIDNAHCEYLQVLITHGIVGFVSLYGWIILSLIGTIKNIKNCKLSAVYAVTIIAYLSSAFVGLNVSYVVILLIANLCYSRMESERR